MMRRNSRGIYFLLVAAWLGGSVLFSACSGEKGVNLPPPKAEKKPPAAEEKPVPPVALTADKNQTPPADAAAPPVENTAPPADPAKNPLTKGNPLRAVDDPPPLGSSAGNAPAPPVQPAPPSQTAVPIPPATPPVPPTAPPAAANALFQGWPAPQVALLLSGEQMGYLEPCGCAGFENMKGGLTRRHECVKQLLAKGWPVVGLDAGGQLNLRRHGKEAEFQFQTTVDSLKAMGYQAIGFGTSDLLLPPDFLLIANVNSGELFTSANVGIDGVKPYQVIKAGGFKLGVVSVLGDKERNELAKIQGGKPNVNVTPAADALRAVLLKLQAEKCDRLILLAYASVADAGELAKAFPEFSIVVSADSANGAEPPAEAGTVPGTNTPLIETGHKGSHVVVLGLYADSKTPFRYQRVAMDKQFKESPEMLQLKAAMQDQLKERGWDGLELKPLQHPTGRKFAGSDECAACHITADEVFQKTPHAHAFTTLAKLTPPRIHDPECVSCHVTGWNFQGFYPYDSGFWSQEKTPKLVHNGCENCHGPGKEHADAEANGNVKEAKLKELRAQLHLSMIAQQNKALCAQCHDGENSPKFDKEFDAYWEKIFHKGKN